MPRYAAISSTLSGKIRDASLVDEARDELTQDRVCEPLARRRWAQRQIKNTA